jgi:hypothetical protein
MPWTVRLSSMRCGVSGAFGSASATVGNWPTQNERTSVTPPGLWRRSECSPSAASGAMSSRAVTLLAIFLGNPVQRQPGLIEKRALDGIEAVTEEGDFHFGADLPARRIDAAEHRREGGDRLEAGDGERNTEPCQVLGAVGIHALLARMASSTEPPSTMETGRFPADINFRSGSMPIW